jgi:hypothetical protein
MLILIFNLDEPETIEELVDEQKAKTKTRCEFERQYSIYIAICTEDVLRT